MSNLLKVVLIGLLALAVLAGAVYITYAETSAYYLRLMNPIPQEQTEFMKAVMPKINSKTMITDKTEEILSYLDTYYINDYDAQKLADAVGTALIDATEDPWSYYLSAEQVREYNEVMENAYCGIGVTIQEDEEAGGMRIVEIEPEGPAFQAGIRLDDILTHVEEQPVLELAVAGTRELVRGEQGTPVHLTLLRDGEQYEVEVVRDIIQTEVAVSCLLDENVGYVLILNFDERCAEETIACIEDVIGQGAESLLFDVRFNSGGYKDEMVKVLDYLLPAGELFVSVDYEGNREVDRSDKRHIDLPMAVLINEESYSAAEFFASAIQDFDAGVVVGEQTSGKGEFQVAFPLSDGSLLNLSIGKYYTPSGVDLSESGVTPDIKVELSEEDFLDLYYGLLEPEEDPQLQAAIRAIQANLARNYS